MVQECQLEVRQIQGNVYPGFNKPFQMLLFFTMQDVEQCRLWLQTLAPEMATMYEVLEARRLFRDLRERRGSKPSNIKLSWTNICLSGRGLTRLGIDLSQFTDRGFRLGLPARSALLGDPVDTSSPGHPSNWVIGGPESMPDAMMLIGSDSDRMLEEEVEKAVAAAKRHRLTCIFTQPGGVRPDLPGKEHFGFEDGVSQPGMRGRASAAEDDYVTPREVRAGQLPQTLLYGRPGEDLVWPGEFVFGYPGQGPDPLIPGDVRAAGPDWAKNGSYVVFRRLNQDVAEFNRFCKEQAERLAKTEAFADIDPTHFASLLVGRWPSGAPISRVPREDNEALALDVHANNWFGFGEKFDPLRLDVADYAGDDYPPAEPDALGLVCPQAAHIRKVNPRDVGNDDGGHMAQYRRRLIRRGVPFGPPYKDYPAVERGLLFISYQTSITDQFEFLSGSWMSDRAPPRLPGGDDVFAGQNGRPGEERVRRCTLFGRNGAGEQVSTEGYADWVVPTGGGYFFAPSITALQAGMKFD